MMGYGEFVERKYEGVGGVGVDFGMKMFVINRLDGGLLVDGVVGVVVVRVERFEKVDVVVDV